jgi:phenylacetate-coenzyme A ligase PaaK-like adenylate-forming protein
VLPTTILRSSKRYPNQIAFMRGANPFWNERLTRAAVDETKIAGFGDLALIPILTKEELRSLRPSVLLPQNMDGDIAIGRWTSGTSGRPTVNFWSTMTMLPWSR